MWLSQALSIWQKEYADTLRSAHTVIKQSKNIHLELGHISIDDLASLDLTNYRDFRLVTVAAQTEYTSYPSSIVSSPISSVRKVMYSPLAQFRALKILKSREAQDPVEIVEQGDSAKNLMDNPVFQLAIKKYRDYIVSGLTKMTQRAENIDGMR
ncbi:MAG: hypothetical protein P8P79_01695 [Halioglobus sp.]|nr:hypothetical protein [Halioglobus sp.]